MHHPVNVAQIKISFTEKKKFYTIRQQTAQLCDMVGGRDPHGFLKWHRTPAPAHLTGNGSSERQVQNWKPLVTPWDVTSMVAVFQYLPMSSCAVLGVTKHGSVLIQDSIYRFSDFLPLCWFSHPCNFNRNAYFGITINFIWFPYLLTWFATTLTIFVSFS